MLTSIAKFFWSKFAKHRKRFMHIKGDILMKDRF